MTIEMASTEGCRTYGHPDLCFSYDSSIVPRPDADWLLRYLKESVSEGREYRHHETIQVGFSICMFYETEHGLLELFEPDWSGETPIRFVPRMTATLHWLRVQRDVAESLGLSGDYPNIRQSAVVCDEVAAKGCGTMERSVARDADSGWFLGCDDLGHDHGSSKNLKRVSLYEATALLPVVTPFLALPTGVSVVPGTPEVYLEGELLQPRPGSLLASMVGTR